MENDNLPTITVLGAGSWGTALALYLGRRGQKVHIWSVDTTEIDAMVADKANHRYLPGIPLPATITPHLNLEDAIDGITDILIVVPSIGFRQTLMSLKPLMTENQRLICATKGLDAHTGKLLSEVVHEVFGENQKFAMLSGPSFAKEVANGLPVAVDIASNDAILLNDLIHRFHDSLFSVYPSNDIIGVEVGGVVKNVIAIITGISDGLKLGASARSALITLGFAEMQKLGKALGANPETFTGLSGIGDLILTASDDQSRNRRLGLAIGSGQTIQQAEKEIGQIIEGKRNAELVILLAQKHKLSLPVCEAVWAILQEKQTPKDALTQLFGRKAAGEVV